MKELVETLAAWRADGVEIGRAVVVRTFGSAPRLEGAVLLAAADGRIAGSVSGGCVEGAAVEEIQHAWASRRSRVVRYGITDEQAWDVGLACGGVIDVLIEPEVGQPIESAARAAAAPGASHGRAVITPLPGDSPGAAAGSHPRGEGEAPAPALVAWDDGRLEGSLGDEVSDGELARLALDELARGTSRTVELGGRSLFIEVFPPQPRLIVFGAAQIAIPLVSIAHAIGYQTIVVDYVGAIGSRKKLAARKERLAAAGARAEDLERLRSPIGLDLGGRAPAETALAIMAEIVAARYGGTGSVLRDKARTEAGRDPATVVGVAGTGG